MKQWGKEKRVIFFNFRQPPNALPIHSSVRERTWPEAHCHVCDCRAFSTMTCWESTTFSARRICYSFLPRTALWCSKATQTSKLALYGPRKRLNEVRTAFQFAKAAYFLNVLPMVTNRRQNLAGMFRTSFALPWRSWQVPWQIAFCIFPVNARYPENSV